MSDRFRSWRYWRKLLLGGVTRILGGSLIGQGTLLAVSPLLTRLYTPQDFAALALFTAFATVLGGVITLSWERVIVIPRSEAQARVVIRLGIASVTVIGTLVTIGAYVAGPGLDETFGVHVFGPWWWLLPATVVVMGVYTLLSSWLIRMQAYGKIAVRNAVQGVSQAISSVFLGVLGAGTVGLLSGMGVGRALALIGIVPWRTLKPQESLSWARVFTVAKRYRRFPLISTWSRVLNILGLQLPAILVVAIYGSWEAGLYALTVRVLATPIGVVTDAVSQYFEGVFGSRMRARSSQLASLILTIAGRLFLLALVPTLVIMLFAPALFAWVFGEEWRQAGVFAQVVVVLYAVQFAVSPVSRALLLLEKQLTQLSWDISRVVLISGAILFPLLIDGSLTLALVTLASTQTVLYGILLAVCVREAGRAERNAQKK